MSAGREYLLIDGAIFAEAPTLDMLIQRGGSSALYADLGAEAARVGPWLLPMPAVGNADWLGTLRSEAEDAEFGLARLRAEVSQPMLLDHLQRLRFVSSGVGRPRYFLRYADRRALSSLWSALGLPQQKALLGPVSAWQWAWDRQDVEALQPAFNGDMSAAAPMPLYLTPAQFKEVLDAGRAGELLASTLEYFPECHELAAPAARFQAARQVHAWLAAQGIGAAPLQMAVLRASLRSEGRVLADPAFAACVEQAQRDDHPGAVLAWSPGTPMGVPAMQPDLTGKTSTEDRKTPKGSL